MRKIKKIGAYLKLKTNEIRDLINNRVITIDAENSIDAVANVVCLDLRTKYVQYITNIKVTCVAVQSKYAVRIELTPNSFISSRTKSQFSFVENKLLTINVEINNEELLYAQVLPYTKIAKDLKKMLKPTETTTEQVEIITETPKDTVNDVIKAIVIKAKNAKELEQNGMTFIFKDDLRQYPQTGLVDECNAQVEGLTAHYTGLNYRLEFRNCVLYWLTRDCTTLVLEQYTADTTKEKIIK